MELKDALGIKIPGQGFTAETIQFWRFGVQLIDSAPHRSVLLQGSFRLTVGGQSSVVTLGEDPELINQLILLPRFLGLEVRQMKMFDSGLLEIEFDSAKIETHDEAWELWEFCTPRDLYANFMEGARGSILHDYGHLLQHEPEWSLF